MLNTLGLPTRPVPSFPRHPVSSEPGSSDMHSRMILSQPGNHRPPSPAFHSSGLSPEKQPEIPSTSNADLLQYLAENPDELQRLFGLAGKGPNKPK